MKKIQVVQFVETLGKGGLENVIYNIATGLDKNIFDITVISRIEGGDTADRLVKSGILVNILNYQKIPIWRIKNILQENRNGQPAILHCHGLFSSSTEAIIASFIDYDAVFVHVHNLERPTHLKQRLKLMILKRRVKKFIAVSNAVSEYLSKSSIKNIKVMPNSISTQKFTFSKSSSEEKFGFPSETFLLGMVGRIVERKGYKQFIDIIEKSNNIRGLVVGEGEYQNEMKMIVNRKKLDSKIRFLPFQSQDNLADIYSKLDGIFLFSTKEGLPLAILEAQSVGVPYIGNDVGGVGEVISNNYNGFLIDKININEIDRITKRIREQPDFYRKNARAVIEKNYSLEKMIEDLKSLYCEYV
jgi:glycosyltransferase involved in cell wall biosynthesis